MNDFIFEEENSMLEDYFSDNLPLYSATFDDEAGK